MGTRVTEDMLVKNYYIYLNILINAFLLFCRVCDNLSGNDMEHVKIQNKIYFCLNVRVL
jgi:hypothetical protein